MVQVDATATTYSYLGALRVKKVSGSTTTVYVFSGSKVIAEYVNSALSKEYIYGGSALLATYEGATLKYHQQDHLSVRLTTDTAGTVLAQQGHYPFGEQWYAGAGSTKWQFTSYERDAESGLDQAVFRYDSTRVGRFTSPDPLAGSTASPQSLNRYAYVQNDPINLTDPLGLECVWEDGRWKCTGVTVEVTGSAPEVNFIDASMSSDNFFDRTAGLGGIFRNWFFYSGVTVGGGGGDANKEKAKEVINNALKEKNLSKCLNKYFGPGTILTNENLPRIDASQNLPGAAIGRTDPKQVPDTGRATIQIDRGNFGGMPANDRVLTDTYLHETANALAIQRFTNINPRWRRPYMGALGGPPTNAQKHHPWDPDIGEQFEECLHENN